MTELTEATPNSTEHLIDMMRCLWTTPTSRFNEALSRKCLAEMFANRNLGRVWLINENQGYLVLTFGYSLEFGRDAFIDELFIAEPYRNKGKGAAALDLASREARKLGIQALHLEVADANDQAEALYLRKCFKRHNRRLMTRGLTTEIQTDSQTAAAD